VVNCSRTLDVRLDDCAAVHQWCVFNSRQGKNTNLAAQKSNSNTVWFNLQTYIYMSCTCYYFVQVLEMPVQTQGHCGFHSFPVVD
jgi:hypothetical protein